MDKMENNLQISQFPFREDENNEETAETESFAPSIVDESHIFKLTRKFVRIEYPGFVKNVPKALETLGGVYNIETAIFDQKKRLELRFHPENRFNKPCCSDRDTNPGLVLEVTKKGGRIDYNIVGYTFQNFKFNKAVDFQFLPLLEDKDKTEKVDYVHEKIFPKKLPTIEFLTNKENASQSVLLLPSSFSRYDISHHTLYLNAKEKFNLEKNDRPELFKMFSQKKPKARYQYRQISYLLNINDPALEIPTKPNPLALKLIKDRLFEDYHKQVKKLFNERPMWSKAAIQHKTGITYEMVKIILPANAYFWLNGPWRVTWTKFGVDPRKDFNLRIYQTLDFRIRAREGTKLKVRAKRAYAADNFMQTKKVADIDESHYILSPDFMPPARQMFYQYCDIKIPEIQDMLQRLPKTPGNQKCDPKTGWLPVNFSEQCREIANRYVMERVRQELMEDSLRLQSKLRSSPEKDTDEESSAEQDNPLSYSSSMLNKMQKGFRRNLGSDKEEISDKTVVLTDDESGDEEMDQVDMEEIVKSISATIDENSDVEQLSDDSEMELDMEAVEEINQLISDTKKSS